MITSFKIYESINEGDPQVGDYVICEEKYSSNSKLAIFINNNIGQIISEVRVEWPRHRHRCLRLDDGETSYDVFYDVFYENIPLIVRSGFKYNLARNMKRSEILYWSNNKEELEDILIGQKYNL